MSFKTFFRSPRRRKQILMLCAGAVILNVGTFLYSNSYNKNRPGSSIKEQQNNLIAFDIFGGQSESTVSYNEIPPGSLVQDSKVPKSKSSIRTRGPTVPPLAPGPMDNKVAPTFPELDNPWFSHEHDGQHNSDPLGLGPDDYVNRTVESCSFRTFKNATVFSQSEFIHEYVDYKRCNLLEHPEYGSLDHWIRSHLAANTGTSGQMIIKSRFQYEQDLSYLSSDESPRMLVLAISRSKEERDNIRATWGQLVLASKGKYQLLFFIGHSLLEDQDEFAIEVEEHNDIVRTDIEESDPAFDFTLTVSMLSWMYVHCPRARFVVKTTSDAFINVHKMEQLIDQEMFAANRMYGELLKRMEPQRDSQSQIGHFVPESQWPWDNYPPFIEGPSVVISGDVVPRLLMAVTVLPTMPLVQVYLTGLVPLLGHIMRIGVSAFFGNADIDSDWDWDAQEPCYFGKYGGIHNVRSLDKMQLVQDMVDKVVGQNITCNTGPRCLVMVEGKCMKFGKEELAKTKKKTLKRPRTRNSSTMTNL